MKPHEVIRCEEEKIKGKDPEKKHIPLSVIDTFTKYPTELKRLELISKADF